VKGCDLRSALLKKRMGKIEGMYPGWRSQFHTVEKGVEINVNSV
jgi:hypothetical protein